MPGIQRADLPPATADGSAQWFSYHTIPTHGQAKAISQAFYERLSSPDVLGIQTVVVRTLTADALVKDDDGKQLDWSDGEGIESYPQAIVSAMYDVLQPVIEALFPEAPKGNREGRRQTRR